jgi:3-methyladenine DNA glycosylase AlkD
MIAIVLGGSIIIPGVPARTFLIAAHLSPDSGGPWQPAVPGSRRAWPASDRRPHGGYNRSVRTAMRKAEGCIEMSADVTAKQFVERLEACRLTGEREKIQRYFKTGKGEYAEGDVFLGVRMGDVFRLAKEFIDMPPAEIEHLLESPVHEVRAGALAIMGKQAARAKTPQGRRKELYDLYLRRTDRINNWDLVDLSCQQVIGAYLFHKPRDVLYELAASESMWERRIAILSTMYFVRAGDLDDTYKIATILLHGDRDLIQKAVGATLRECGEKDRGRLLRFLDEHAALMPRTLLRYATEHLDPELRAHYRNMRP